MLLVVEFQVLGLLRFGVSKDVGPVEDSKGAVLYFLSGTSLPS